MRRRVKNAVIGKRNGTIGILCGVVFSVLFTVGGCDKLKNNLKIEETSITSYMMPHIGNWREVFPCENQSLLTFSYDTIYHNWTYDNSIDKLTYHFISSDSIHLERTFGIQPDAANVKIIFYSNDSMRIENYYPCFAAVYPPIYTDIVLVRIKQ